MKDYLYTLPDSLQLREQPGSFYRYREAVTNDIQTIFHKYGILYLIGSTWIHFGKYQHSIKQSADILKYFGTLTWNETVNGEDWKFVAESQLRLVHWINGWNLIDLVNHDDYFESFNSKQTDSVLDEYSIPLYEIQNQQSNCVYRSSLKKFVVYLLRDCHRHEHRSEC